MLMACFFIYNWTNWTPNPTISNTSFIHKVTLQLWEKLALELDQLERVSTRLCICVLALWRQGRGKDRFIC